MALVAKVVAILHTFQAPCTVFGGGVTLCVLPAWASVVLQTHMASACKARGRLSIAAEVP